jgi:hypothetical protein
LCNTGSLLIVCELDLNCAFLEAVGQVLSRDGDIISS